MGPSTLRGHRKTRAIDGEMELIAPSPPLAWLLRAAQRPTDQSFTPLIMPKIRIHNQTKGTALPDGIVILVRAGVTNGQGAFDGKPHELEVQVGKFIIYDVDSSEPFRITAEPKGKTMKAANFFSKQGTKADAAVYIVANKDNLEVSYDKPAG